jgi:sortase A
MRPDPTSTWLRSLETVLLVAGVAGVTWYAVLTLAAMFFQFQQRATLQQIVAARELPREQERLIGQLEIPRVRLSAAVVEGDDDSVLQLAIGYLADTPLPWQDGNSALAGHRDGFFRPLQYIRIGDEVRFLTPHGDFRYRVRRTLVVDPEDVWVLDSSPHVNLTLITCFPFSYVGHAPRRFVVQAERIR